MLGCHTLAHWSSTQSIISLSSAEAELNSLVKMVSESLGLRNLFKAMGKDRKVRVYTDISARNGIVHREGCGRVKHLKTRQLWVQEFVNNKTVDVQKVPRERNCSDC